MDEEIEKRRENILKNVKKTFLSWVTDNYDKVFLVVLVLAFIIRLIIFFKTSNQPLWWDEADYLSAGKRLGLGLDIKDIWYYRRGFLFPLISALFFRINFGEIGIRFLNVLFSTGIIVISYFLISKMFSKKLALLTSIALSLSWVILFFTGRILTDIPAAFFLLLALLLFWKGYVLKEGNKFLYFFGLVFALAVLTRMQSLMLAPPFLIYILMKEKLKIFKNKKLWITLGIFLLALIPHFILYSFHYGNPFADITHYYLKIGSETAVAQTSSFSEMFNYFKDIPYIISGVADSNPSFINNFLFNPIFLMLILGIIYFLGDLFIGLDKLSKNSILQNKFFIILWIISLFFIMGFIAAQAGAPYVEQRYMTAGLPFLFLIIVSPLLLVEKLIQKYFKLNKVISFLAITFVLILLLISNITLTNSLIESKKTSYSEIKYVGELLKENSNKEDIIMSTSLPQITYYSERSTYPYDIKAYLLRQGEKNVTYSEGEEGFKEFLLDKKPKFLMASFIFEDYPEWILFKGQQNGLNFISMPFFNSSIVYNAETNQIVSIDLKGEVKKEDMILHLFFPKSVNDMNSIFVYEVEYT